MFIVTRRNNLQKTIPKLIEYAKNQKIWLLKGAMGAGKTTLTKAICQQLGVQENVTSPTFSLLNVYKTLTGRPIYHFDFYRIQDEKEALDLGCEIYFDSNCYCFIEWPSKIPNCIPTVYFEITITVKSDQMRHLQLKHFEV